MSRGTSLNDSWPYLTNYGMHGRLDVRSVKLFADGMPLPRTTLRRVNLWLLGALGSWGAALLEPYSDKPESNGLLLKEPAELAELINRCWVQRLQVVCSNVCCVGSILIPFKNIHCIGDRANHVVLNILEDLIQRENIDVPTWRPRIEHAQIFTLNDIERIGRLGGKSLPRFICIQQSNWRCCLVIASVQPTHAWDICH